LRGEEEEEEEDEEEEGKGKGKICGKGLAGWTSAEPLPKRIRHKHKEEGRCVPFEAAVSIHSTLPCL
jgi:hypothetical protein